MSKITQEEFNKELDISIVYRTPKGTLVPTGPLVDKEEYKSLLQGCLGVVGNYHGLSMEEAQEYFDAWASRHRNMG